MPKSLLDSFALLDQGIKDLIADADSSPRLLAFLALHIAQKNFNTHSLSAEHIIACLEAAGVAATKKSIGRALAGTKGSVTRSISDDGEVFYRLMTKGEREAEKILAGAGGVSVFRVESGTPRQARRKLGEILKSLQGTLRICDPFYGISTLDSLDLIPKKCAIKFLSQKTSEPKRKIDGALRDFYKERPQTEFRIAAGATKIHDRYIATKDEILILGHGLKDIGNKESFVIKLDKNLVPDLVNETIGSFDKEWGTGQKI